MEKYEQEIYIVTWEEVAKGVGIHNYITDIVPISYEKLRIVTDPTTNYDGSEKK